MPDEVEDFLRRVAQMRAQAQAKSEQPPAAPNQTPPKQKQSKQQRTKPPARLVPAGQDATSSRRPPRRTLSMPSWRKTPTASAGSSPAT